MPSKSKYWHKAWSWHAPGVAVHDSGLQVTSSSGRPPWVSVTACALYESARGVCDKQMPERVAALVREGRRWLDDPRNHRPPQVLQTCERVAHMKQG
jgi:hypothetical protein